MMKSRWNSKFFLKKENRQDPDFTILESEVPALARLSSKHPAASAAPEVINSPGTSSASLRNSALKLLIQGESSFRFPGAFEPLLILPSSELVTVQKSWSFMPGSLEPPLPKWVSNSFPKACN